MEENRYESAEFGGKFVSAYNNNLIGYFLCHLCSSMEKFWDPIMGINMSWIRWGTPDLFEPHCLLYGGEVMWNTCQSSFTPRRGKLCRISHHSPPTTSLKNFNQRPTHYTTGLGSRKSFPAHKNLFVLGKISKILNGVKQVMVIKLNGTDIIAFRQLFLPSIL